MKGYKHKRDMIVGSVFKSNYCGDIEILAYKAADDVTVKFLNTGTILDKIHARLIRKGAVSDPFHPYVAGLGYMGEGIYNSKTHKAAYQRWWGIFYRIFLSNDPNNLSSYKDCFVDGRWCNFQIFAQWYYDQSKHPDEVYDIDKDLKIKGNRVYGPDTCLLIPESLNVLLSSDKSNPIAPGVSFHGGKFRARVTIDGVRKTIGRYDTPQEASQMYWEGRYAAIISRAENLHKEGKLHDDILSIIYKRFGRT